MSSLSSLSITSYDSSSDECETPQKITITKRKTLIKKKTVSRFHAVDIRIEYEANSSPLESPCLAKIKPYAQEDLSSDEE